jgi:hypothetical protein
MPNGVKKYIFCIVSILLIVSSLNSQDSLINNYPLTKDATTNDTLVYREGSEKQVEVWKLDHYKPEPGKKIGVWLTKYSRENLSEVRNKWGYQNIFIPNPNNYNIALAAGYCRDEIMMNTAFKKETKDYKKIISSCDARYYYIDEAVNHSCFGNGNKRLYSPAELKNISDFIHRNRSGSFFVSSGYKRCSHFDTLVSITDRIMYSAYSNWYKSILPCISTNIGWEPSSEPAWLNGSDDQRISWEDMKNRYGVKFSMTWINSNENNEFNDLFEEAKKLGLDEVWIYTLDGHHSDEFGNISEAACYNGFLKRFMRKYIEVYKCTCLNGCSEFNPENKSCWQMQKEISTDTLLEN